MFDKETVHQESVPHLILSPMTEGSSTIYFPRVRLRWVHSLGRGRLSSTKVTSDLLSLTVLS